MPNTLRVPVSKSEGLKRLCFCSWSENPYEHLKPGSRCDRVFRYRMHDGRAAAPYGALLSEGWSLEMEVVFHEGSEE